MDMDIKEPKKVKGIKIRNVNYVMVIVSAVLYVILLFVTVQISLRYDDMVFAVDDYIDCEEKAQLVEDGSDYLTLQVRLYVMTGDVQHMNAYFEEVNVTKRREKALEQLEKNDASDKAKEFLASALEKSRQLEEREKYAMKLVSYAYGYDEAGLPEEVQDVELKAEDRSLSSEEMLKEGQNMVFDPAYQGAKDLIMGNISYFTSEIVNGTKQKQSDSIEALKGIITHQRIYISILFVLNIVTFIMVTVLIIKPLQVYIKCIKEEKMLEIVGSYEFRYLALTYNDIYELNAENEEMLLYRAEHDPLTGAINRGGFDKLRMLLKMRSDPLALLLIDVDNFKQVNDNHGHEVGDEVLRKVARLAEAHFRSHDFVARIGGDEFAVIMTNVTPELKAIIREKIRVMNETLMNPRDDLPEVSLSVGVAFSDQGFYDNLYSEADSALYAVKENGRCGCMFFEKV